MGWPFNECHVQEAVSQLKSTQANWPRDVSLSDMIEVNRFSDGVGQTIGSRAIGTLGVTYKAGHFM
jgi:hypothetical protein